MSRYSYGLRFQANQVPLNPGTSARDAHENRARLLRNTHHLTHGKRSGGRAKDAVANGIVNVGRHEGIEDLEYPSLVFIVVRHQAGDQDGDGVGEPTPSPSLHPAARAP